MNTTDQLHNRIQVSGLTLKIIAAVCMFIDHFGATVVERYMYHNSAPSYLTTVDNVLRSIGRAAFPLYCFLLVEGFLHTKNLGRYILRLGIFAVISEIPFDMVYYQSLIGYSGGQVLGPGAGKTVQPHVLSVLFQNQNTLFTLLIGLLAISALSRIRMLGDCEESDGRSKPAAAVLSLFKDQYMRIIISGCAVIIGLALAWLIKGDYGMYGYLSIVVLYQLIRAGGRPELSVGISTLLLACFSEAELFALWILIPLWFYNGERGNYSKRGKWFFYWFYPMHLLVLSAACLIIRAFGSDMGWFLTDVLVF